MFVHHLLELPATRQSAKSHHARGYVRASVAGYQAYADGSRTSQPVATMGQVANEPNARRHLPRGFRARDLNPRQSHPIPRRRLCPPALLGRCANAPEHSRGIGDRPLEVSVFPG